MKKLNWKTTAFGLLSIAVAVAKIRFPAYAIAADMVIPALLGGGLIMAQDGNKEAR